MLVQVYTYNQHGDMQMLESSQKAGTEQCRLQLYASRCAKRHGLRLLPQLEKDELCAEGEDLNTLHLEAQKILLHLDEHALESGLQPAYIASCISNVLHAIEQAQRLNGGVYIG